MAQQARQNFTEIYLSHNLLLAVLLAKFKKLTLDYVIDDDGGA